MAAPATSSRFKSILAWALGVFFVLIGLISIGAHPIRGILLFLAAAILIPPTSRLIQEKAKLSLPRSNKIIVGIFALVIAISLTPSPDTTQNTTTASNDTAPVVEQPQTPEDKIRAVVADVHSGQTNMGKTRIISTEVMKEGNGYKVWVKFNADENLTANMTISAMKSDMAAYYIALYSQDLGVVNAAVTANLELTDKYGNKSDERVFETVLTKEEAQKLNWSESDTMLRRQFIPNIWVVAYVHPVAR